MIDEMQKNKGGGDGSNQYKIATPTKTEGVAYDETPTYSDLNITYKDAFRCQQMTELPIKRNKIGNPYLNIFHNFIYMPETSSIHKAFKGFNYFIILLTIYRINVIIRA